MQPEAPNWVSVPQTGALMTLHRIMSGTELGPTGCGLYAVAQYGPGYVAKIVKSARKFMLLNINLILLDPQCELRVQTTQILVFPPNQIFHGVSILSSVNRCTGDAY